LTHVLGWELTLTANGQLVQYRVCRIQEEVLSTGEQWRAAIVEKGWA
jgi:hypothetical protein